MHKSKFLIIALCSLLLAACGSYKGGISGSGSSTTPTVTSRTYNADRQIITYSNGTTVTNTATSAPVTWANDHVTRTITYTFADSTTNPVVSTVPGVASTPSYSTNTETIVTTYGVDIPQQQQTLPRVHRLHGQVTMLLEP